MHLHLPGDAKTYLHRQVVFFTGKGICSECRLSMLNADCTVIVDQVEGATTLRQGHVSDHLNAAARNTARAVQQQICDGIGYHMCFELLAGPPHTI